MGLTPKEVMLQRDTPAALGEDEANGHVRRGHVEEAKGDS